MKFMMRDAPEWFTDHLLKNYISELNKVQKSMEHKSDFGNLQFRQMSCDFFKQKGFDVWLDEEGHLWFNIDVDSPKWTFEILRT